MKIDKGLNGREAYERYYLLLIYGRILGLYGNRIYLR